jgi:hypothetical protein
MVLAVQKEKKPDAGNLCIGSSERKN